MKRQIKAAIAGTTKAVFPLLYDRHMARKRAEFNLQATVWNNEIQRILGKIIADSGVYVRGGPFKGMMYWPVGAPGYWAGGLASSLIGVYERELHSSLEELFRQRYENVLNIGCAEGYYAVGLARRLPTARVIAFDIDEKARKLCDGMARVNGVEKQVAIEGECTIDRLRELTTQRSLIVCDIEGSETDLMRPDLVPGLANADIIVELHDVFRPGVTAEVVPRFKATHDISMLTSQPRDPSELASLAFLTDNERRKALDERRPATMQWAVMRSRSFGRT